LVVQIPTAGMERVREALVAALCAVFEPEAIVLRNDGAIRELEGLERNVETVHGEVPDPLEVVENGCRFRIDPNAGQKTGWFYDHRENRRRISRHAAGKRVLDLFSYTGAWGVQAAAAGAASVTCVDTSQSALEMAGENAELNGIGDGFELIKGDAFDVLSHLRAEQVRFDIVVLDPPAFIKRRKDHKRGVEAYRRLNQAALQLIEPGGLLLSASCSHHLDRSTLTEVMVRGARHVDRTLQVVEQGHQAPDHPIHPAIPETAYLKAVLARVLPGEW
jgi:23S rRNA (cytosine1962-C5)-methyltransferase